LKYKLGRIPHLKDFDEMGELDPLRLIDRRDHIRHFLETTKMIFTEKWSDRQYQILEFILRKSHPGCAFMN
jgi:hypothetical protein